MPVEVPIEEKLRKNGEHPHSRSSAPRKRGTRVSPTMRSSWDLARAAMDTYRHNRL